MTRSWLLAVLSSSLLPWLLVAFRSSQLPGITRRAVACSSSRINNQQLDCLNTTIKDEIETFDPYRRSFLFGIGLATPFCLSDQNEASALPFGRGDTKKGVFFVGGDKNASESLQGETASLAQIDLTSELCLLKLLPVKNPVFRGLERSVVALSTLRNAQDYATWKKAEASIIECINVVDTKRSKLEPIFNQEEDTMIQIIKGESGERRIEDFRDQLVELANATSAQNATKTFQVQKKALLALSEIGEFLVGQFPYELPTEGLYSYLPRLLGRAKVSFSIRRKKKILGNVTIIADGFAAPITAGNFVDLSIRNFYTGLPIKLTRKKVGSDKEFEVATIPMLGSFQEGFYDPLTARLRRIPLEIIRVGEGKTAPKLSYAEDDSPSGTRWDFSNTPASVSSENGKSLLSFDIPGLVALNHPDKSLNGGSSEFFSLQKESLPDKKRKLLDGEYAPFGYIVDGYDLFLSLQAGDVIDQTSIDELGQLNLVKLRQSSFSEVVQGAQDFGEAAAEKNSSSAE
ncbi:cis-trans isomerase [Seminavis robusta]|uniref:peptidylprolyl isomerase n=1 Tax=Seminavis robusta TaxID=568900 RepID=A0A9N8EET7_9STRA|nr:cis-trans isomerase [Seminavis robusta]|eukprot:Sro1049_g235380.1 cis-trans isomerase (516) ;mRNA; f:14168-16226